MSTLADYLKLDQHNNSQKIGSFYYNIEQQENEFVLDINDFRDILEYDNNTETLNLNNVLNFCSELGFKLQEIDENLGNRFFEYISNM